MQPADLQTAAAAAAPVAVAVAAAAHYLFTALAILAAGLAVAGFNYLLLKKERLYKIADSFCVNLETFVFDYFAAAEEAQKEIVAEKFIAYLESFGLFVETNKMKNAAKMKEQWAPLLRLEEKPITQKEALAAVAMLRYFLAQ